jgi:pimeloyl-ACP methyl ester carboxylesterase
MTMFQTTPTIMIIPGGWHTPTHYASLQQSLESAGFKVHISTLPSSSLSKPPYADLAADTTHIRSEAESLIEDGVELLVLMHSYGGQVGTNALPGLGLEQRKKKGLKGGVKDLVYLSAAASLEGKSMVDMVRHFDHESLMPFAFDFADDKSCVNRDPKLLLISDNSGVSEGDAEKYVDGLVRWNGQCMYDALTTERAAWRDILVTYVHTTKDMTLPYDYQKVFVEEMQREGAQVQTKTLETGHCANLTATKAVADIVRMVAKGDTMRKESVVEAKGLADVQDAIVGVGSKKE